MFVVTIPNNIIDDYFLQGTVKYPKKFLLNKIIIELFIPSRE